MVCLSVYYSVLGTEVCVCLSVYYSVLGTEVCVWCVLVCTTVF